MSIHKRGQSWFVRYRDSEGTQHNKHFGSGKKAKKLAEEFDLEIKLAKKKKREVINLGGSSMNLEELFSLYIRDYRARGKSAENAYSLEMVFKNKILPNLPYKPVDNLKYEDFLCMIEKFPHLTPTTRNRYFMYSQAVINWGIRHDYVKSNPLRNWKKVKEPQRRFILSQKELYHLLQFCPPHLKLAIQVTYNLGLRPGRSELFALKWENIDFERQEALIYAPKTYTHRRIPIPDQLIPILKKAKVQAKTPYVIEYNGKQVKRLSTSLATALKKAGISTDFRLYDLRHMYASYMIDAGGDVTAVSHMLGHSDVGFTLKTYYQPVSDSKAKAAKLLPKLHEGEDPVERIRRKKEREGMSDGKKKKTKFKVKDVGVFYKD